MLQAKVVHLSRQVQGLRAVRDEARMAESLLHAELHLHVSAW